MTKKYDTLVFIGRFQPVHTAHVEIIERAQKLANKVVVVVGSANKPRTYKNPFTVDERLTMLAPCLSDSKGVFATRVEDSIYDDQAWAVRVQAAVSVFTKNDKKIGIIGHKKDESSFYLDMFPQWSLSEVELIEPLNATHIRDLYFKRDANVNFIKHVVPSPVLQYLIDFMAKPEYEQIIREREFIEDYKKQYASFPYPPVFVTTDAVVIQSGHVLMIKRRSEPGKGLWAFPGGFLDAYTDKTLQDCVIRELKEETGIKVPAPVLIGNIQSVKVFDAISRSERGRTVTHAYNIVLPDGALPKVKGSDDAEKAKWIPISQLNPAEVYEDHYEILQTFIGV